MRAVEILLEYDRSRTMNSIPAGKIMHRMTRRDWEEAAIHWDGAYTVGAGQFEMYCHEAMREPEGEYKRYLKHLLDFMMDLCEQADPTSNKKFVPIILSWWYRGRGMGHFEDIYKAKDALTTYLKFKNRIKGLDLKQIDFYNFMDEMDKVSAIPSGSEADKAEMQRFIDNDDAHLTLDNERVRVVVPKSKEAAIYFGRNTRWCTSARENNAFERYNRDGPLFIVLFKKDNVRWQWHFESQQFMDEKDEDNLEAIKATLPDYPELMELWDSRWRHEMQVGNKTEFNRTVCINSMFEPTLEDWEFVLENVIYLNRALKPQKTFNLVHPLDNPELVALARDKWFAARGEKPDELK